MDARRQNLSEESMVRNVERLKAYRARLVVFPKKGAKGAVPENVAATIKAVLPFESVLPAFSEIKQSDMPKSDEGAYVTLRKARSDARLVGVREKRVKDKAEAEASKK